MHNYYSYNTGQIRNNLLIIICSVNDNINLIFTYFILNC